MKTNKTLVAIIISTLFIFSSCCRSKKWTPLEKEESLSYLQECLNDTMNTELMKTELIPDEEAAINIAESYLFKIYGKSTIVRERPYKIRLINGYWVIIGSLPWYQSKGGSFELIIKAKDGMIKKISHEC